LPWKQFSEPDAGAEYLVVLTYLAVCRLLWLPRFMADMRKIRRQLEARPAGQLAGRRKRPNPVAVLQLGAALITGSGDKPRRLCGRIAESERLVAGLVRTGR